MNKDLVDPKVAETIFELLVYDMGISEKKLVLTKQYIINKLFFTNGNFNNQYNTAIKTEVLSKKTCSPYGRTCLKGIETLDQFIEYMLNTIYKKATKHITSLDFFLLERRVNKLCESIDYYEKEADYNETIIPG